MRLGRVAAVTLSIATIGAIIGAALGAALLAVWGLRLGVRGTDFLASAGFGASVGAGLGAVLAPLTAFAFLRRVPLGRALAQTSLGTTAGAAVGLLVGSVSGSSIMSLPAGLGGALVGFVASAIRLRFATRTRRLDPGREGSGPPVS
jgi:MFS family permease